MPLFERCLGQLNQVIINILSNAIDALDEYNQQHKFQSIVNQSSRIQVSPESIDDQWVLIRITDDGTEISEDV